MKGLSGISLFYLAGSQGMNRRRKYFCRDDITLQPLKPIRNINDDKSNTKSNSFANTVVPVIYTNDKFVATEWIDRHICHRPMIVGWDTEVRRMDCFNGSSLHRKFGWEVHTKVRSQACNVTNLLSCYSLLA